MVSKLLKITHPLIIFSIFFIVPLCFVPAAALALSSNNIPLDSPIYLYLEKLTGLGAVTSDMKGIKPFSKAEAARLVLEAEKNLPSLGIESRDFATGLIKELRKRLSREMSLYAEPEKAPGFDYNLIDYARLRYVYLDGAPRSYTRPVYDRSHQSAFGFIGGDLRDQPPSIVQHFGTEGTPLTENNEGVVYRDGHSAELRWGMEAFVSRWASFAVEPIAITTPDADGSGQANRFALQKGYVKLGGGGLELEVGRDANWFGPGYRGALSLANNAKNFDMIKLSSPESVNVGWVKKYLGDFKYSMIFSRFDETGSGDDRRKPYFFGVKMALKPTPWFEVGGNFVRQEGGPGQGDKNPSLGDIIFGGSSSDTSNSIAGIDVRFRLPWLRNTELYAEYVGEDSASFWPFVESYVAGFFIPQLTADGKNDLRFEFFYGNSILYVDNNFPVAGYTYHGMPVGHSQGGAALEFYLRYSHWFSPRNNLALELIRTDRGHEGRVHVDASGNYDPAGVRQAEERKHAVRVSWRLPVYGDVDMNLLYGWERVDNYNLISGNDQTNHLFRMDLSYRY